MKRSFQPNSKEGYSRWGFIYESNYTVLQDSKTSIIIYLLKNVRSADRKSHFSWQFSYNWNSQLVTSTHLYNKAM